VASCCPQVDANDEMWEKLLALPDMDVDSSAEWSEGPSAAAGGAGSKSRRTGNNDDGDDGEDAAVSAGLGARLSMNECICRPKKRRAHRKRQTKAAAKLLDCAAEKTQRDVEPAQVERAAGGGCCDAAARRVDCVQAGAAGAHSRGVRGGRA